MSMRGNRFEVDRANGKLLGVCAGIANHMGVDATIVRVALVLVTVLGGFPWTLIAYGALYLVGKPRGASAYVPAPIRARDDKSERVRDLDRRMQEIEAYVTSSNSGLAREIEDLR